MSKTYITKFNDVNKKISLRNWIIFSSIVAIAFILLAFLVTLSKNGFKDFELMWKINRNLLITIPIAGFGFGISSFLIQQMSNNKLADTSVLGMGNVNLIALMILIYNIDFGNDNDIQVYKFVYPFMFTITSILVSLLIYFISYNKNTNISKKFIISGLVLNFAFIAISYSLNNFMPSNKSTTIKDFSVGFIDTASSISIYVAIAGFLVAMIWLGLIYEKFKIATTNNDLANQLGINTNRIYLQILVICGLLVGISYSLVGNIVFLGLFVGNMAFNLYKKKFGFAIPTSGFLAIIILALAYLINKNLLSTNINTALLIPVFGIPYFLYLVIKE